MARPARQVTGTVGLARLIHDRPDLVTGPPSCTATGKWATSAPHPDGRTILLDWAYPGSGPACWDLCRYLALNRARLPESKEAAIGRFRAALEARGVATGSWWDTQLDLCLIAIMAAFGWEKALGDDGELLFALPACGSGDLALPAPTQRKPKTAPACGRCHAVDQPAGLTTPRN
jgi:hypothetical protein